MYANSPQASSLSRHFRVWDFSTIDGDGYAVVRAPWCGVAKRTDSVRQGMHLGESWHGEERTVCAYSATDAERRYRRQFAVELDVRHCNCGCLSRVN